MANKQSKGNGDITECRSAILVLIERVFVLLGISWDAALHKGLNRKDTLTPVDISGASVWTGRGKAPCMSLATEIFGLYTAEEIVAQILASDSIGIVVHSAAKARSEGDPEADSTKAAFKALKTLGQRAKGGMPRGFTGVEGLLEDAGVRFAAESEERGLPDGTQRDNLRFDLLVKTAKDKSVVEALDLVRKAQSVFRGYYGANDDGDERTDVETNGSISDKAKADAATESTNKADREKAETKGLVLVKGMGLYLPKTQAKVWNDRLDKEVNADTPAGKAMQRGKVYKAIVSSLVEAARLKGEAAGQDSMLKAAALGKADAKVA